MPTHHARAAVFDVDETLIAVSSLFAFLAFDLAARGRPAAEYDRVARGLRALAARGVRRHEITRAYFALFARRGVAELAERGERWFAHEQANGGLFHAPVLAAFERHAAAGDLTMLVSGSSAACIDPIARFVGAEVVICTLPEQRGDRYTGRVAVPMIAEAKAAAVRETARVHGVRLADIHAYGDHASDLPFLHLAGHPVVVGNDAVLARAARHQGWARLPGASPSAAPPAARSPAF